jgi:hypothetical protein
MAHTPVVVSHAVPWWVWLLPLLFGAPWIAAIVYYWRRARPLDGALPASAADLARKRLWTP